MAVQLHYYGSVFDLSETYSDDHWVDKFSAAYDKVRDSRSGTMLAFLLADGRSLDLVFDVETRYALVVSPNRYTLNSAAFD